MKKQAVKPEPINVEALEKDAEEQTRNQAARFSLEEIVALGDKLEDFKKKRDAMTELLDAVNRDITLLETETLPEGLKNLGIRSLTLTSGAEINLVDVISASITDENRPQAHAWLRKEGHGDIIKNNVTVSFGKGEDQYADRLQQELLRMRDDGELKFGDVIQKEAVHPSTLKAFVKQQVQDGNEFPGELFKLYTGHAVKMTK